MASSNMGDQSKQQKRSRWSYPQFLEGLILAFAHQIFFLGFQEPGSALAH